MTRWMCISWLALLATIRQAASLALQVVQVTHHPIRLRARRATCLAHHHKQATSLALQTTHHPNRRAFLSKSSDALVAIGLNPAVVYADEGVEERSDRGGRPFAPLQALLPATRLKLWMDDVYLLSRDIATAKDQQERFRRVQLINERLSNPPKLFQGEKMGKRASSSTAQLTTGISSVNKDQYQSNRKGFNPGDKITAMLNQADVERQWGMLQYAESKREEGNEMRAAFNFYARQLTFADEYLLTASKEDRKRMIRNDEVPTLAAVITSDLDRRDLYRNQFLTAIDDAAAEAAYLVKQKGEEEDVELVELVKQAHDALESWFALIVPQDVEEAVREVQSSI